MDGNLFGDIALWTSVLLNLPGALALCWGLADGFFVGRHWTLKLAVVLMISGLVGQFARSYIALSTGFAPTDAEIPFWILKDLGIVIYGAHYAMKCLGNIKMADER